jgi:uncharacterized protein (TIGR02147 family)
MKSSAQVSTPPNVYQYDDFRSFLRDAFESKKAADPSYSHRKFSAAAGIANPGYLLDVILGKRTLSLNQANRMVSVFGLNASEAEFFLLLLKFGQSKKDTVRHEVYQKILLRRGRSRFTRMSPSLTKYYQDYHYSLVRCGIDATDFRGDYEALGKFISPQLSPSLTRKYVTDLVEWKLVVKEEDGRYRVTDQFVEPPATLSALIRHLNREWILQAAEAPFKFGPLDRHISTLLLTVSRKTKKLLLEKAELFRKEVLDIVEQDGAAETILQLSIQIFPKSQQSGMTGKSPTGKSVPGKKEDIQ